MKNKKLSLSKINLNKMTISSLQSVKGGNENDEIQSDTLMSTELSICCGFYTNSRMTGICC